MGPVGSLRAGTNSGVGSMEQRSHTPNLSGTRQNRTFWCCTEESSNIGETQGLDSGSS